MLGFRFAAEAAEKGRPERIPVVNKNVIVRAFGAHASETQSDKFLTVVGLDQPLAVAVLGVIRADGAVGDDAPGVGEDSAGLVARHQIDGRIPNQNK